MYDNLKFGAWLKNRRNELDFTREELARHVGISPILVYKLEAEERRPSKQTAAILARVLEISPTQLEDFIKFARQTNRTSSTAPVKGIPSSITPLIGRDREISKIEDMIFVDHNRLMIFTGLPGVGKTTLAAQTLYLFADRFDDQSYFVPLAPVRDADSVASTIAQTIGLQEVTDQTPTDQLKHFFAKRMSLLVLDNFEHLQKSKSLIVELSAACPHLHIIITTRAALKLPNEAVLRIKPLKTPDAKQPIGLTQAVEYSSIELFVHYARASQPTFVLTEDNAPAVAQICTRLEGVPLAIVLAAARIKMFSPASLYEHLNKRLSSVTAAHQPTARTHQTLRDALAWSYDLLTASQKQLFTRLAVFVNGASFEAIEKICREQDEDILSTLEALVDQNLVQETQNSAGQNRFSMLETVREYALEQLDQFSAYEVDSLRRMHAQYFLSVAEQAEPFLRTKDQLIWLARLTADQDNFEAALEWSLQFDPEINLRLASALGMFWYIGGRLQRGTYWLKHATKNAQNAPLRFRANAYFYISVIGSVTGDFQWALEASEEAVRLFRILQDDRMVGRALAGHLTSHLSLGHWDKLEELLREGMELAQRTNDKHTSAAYGLHIAIYQPDSNAKVNTIEAYLPAIRDTGERWLLNTALVELGQTYIYMGKYQRAEAILRECLKSCQELSDIRLTGWALGALGEAQFHLGDVSAAAKLIIESLGMSRDVNELEGTAVRLTQLSTVFQAIGHNEFAVHLLGNVSNLMNSGNQLAREIHMGRYNKVVDKAREELSPNAFTACWNAGKMMKQEQAVEYALSYAMFEANLV